MGERSLKFKKAHKLESEEQSMEVPQEIKIMQVMKRKYADVVEFFRDTNDLKQLPLAFKEYHHFSKSYQEMMKFMHFNPRHIEFEILNRLKPKYQ
jgi:hypothetical protein